YGAALEFTAARVRDTISPIVQMGVLLAIVLWWRQPDRPELFPFRRPASTTPEPVASPAKPMPARSGSNGQADAGAKVTTRRPPAPARSGSRRR
ncbi:MAG TPA: hypothetical protein VE547_01990, partial [Mycobacteriales bacterium]|nr:hypothetical protein [Mycobacteriales bacterium]